MRFTQLGRTGLTVSQIGFGGATLGDQYGAMDDAEGQRAVDVAIDHGVNLFDVSPYYGRTVAEERLGRYLHGKRDRVIVSTKVGRYDRHLPEGFDFSAARVMRSVEESLSRLRTDVIDIYLAHDIEFSPLEVILGETIPALERLKEQGKVRFIGVSGFPLEVLREAVEGADLDVVLSYCHYSLLNTRLESVLAPVVRERSMGLINASPLHMGILSPQGPPPWHPAPAEVVEAGARAAKWCRERGLSLPEIALRFAVSSPEVHSTLVGVRAVEELEASLRALQPDPDPEASAALRSLLAPVHDREWPSGLWEGVPGEVS